MCVGRLPILILSAALCYTGAVQAEDCSDRKGTDEMYSCFEEQLWAAEKRVNELYAFMVSTIPAEYRELLTRSQSTWVAYRDAQCTFQFAGDDPRRKTPCRLQLTEQRETFLREEVNEECNGCIVYKK